jgi:hypothetical protein
MAALSSNNQPCQTMVVEHTWMFFGEEAKLPSHELAQSTTNLRAREVSTTVKFCCYVKWDSHYNLVVTMSPVTATTKWHMTALCRESCYNYDKIHNSRQRLIWLTSAIWRLQYESQPFNNQPPPINHFNVLATSQRRKSVAMTLIMHLLHY